jgi:hypothetical protein
MTIHLQSIMWVENMENMDKKARMQNFSCIKSEDDTGGLPKMHLAEVSGMYILDWTGSQYMVQILLRIYTNELYNSIQTNNF